MSTDTDTVSTESTQIESTESTATESVVITTSLLLQLLQLTTLANTIAITKTNNFFILIYFLTHYKIIFFQLNFNFSPKKIYITQ